MLRKSSPQLHRRPLLSRDTDITEDSMLLVDTNKNKATSNKMEQRALGSSSNNNHALAGGNHTSSTGGSNSSSKPQRRLRIFGALTGNSGNGGTPAKDKDKTAQIPLTSDDPSPSSSSVSSRMVQYDTRPIYTPTAVAIGPLTEANDNNNNDDNDNEQEERPPSRSAQQQSQQQPQQQSQQQSQQQPQNRSTGRADPTGRNEKATTATVIAPLQSNQKDSDKTHARTSRKAKIRELSNQKKADPPTKEELVANVIRQQQQQQAQAQQVVADLQRQQQQKQVVESKKQTSTAATTTTSTKAKQQQHPSSLGQPQPAAAGASDVATRPKSVLRKREIVEEKKTEDRELSSSSLPRPTSSRSTSAQLNAAAAAAASNGKSSSKSGMPDSLATTTAHHTAAEVVVDPTKAMLSRPFGRSTIPVHLSRKFVVEVSSAEWDADEERWKYRILVQQRPQSNQHKQRGSFTTAYTWRSLADFEWLEKALRWEFHGALLVPLLNMALGVASVSPTTAVPVEAESLRNWLSDLLNGIRGQGEWMYLDSCSSTTEASILQSEAMEIFLYRTGALTDDLLANFTLFSGWQEGKDRNPNESMVQRFLNRSIEQLVPLTELCVGPMPQNQSVAYHGQLSKQQKQILSKQPRGGLIMCHSTALATATSSDLSDSFGAESVRNATGQEHSILLMHYLVRNYRETALSALEKLSLLRPAEEALGVAWKRMAIALTNLFAYEKDVESAKLGDLKAKRENMPFRKVQKSQVDDGLRVLSRHKVERSAPALQSVSVFLSALLSDLSTVPLAAEAFRKAHRHAQQQQQQQQPDMSTVGSATYDDGNSRASSSWRSRAAQSILSLQRAASDDTMQNLFSRRFQRNQEALENALVQLLRHLPVRMARMAWRYWQCEISQVAELHKSAASLRSKVAITKEEYVTRMLKRHGEEEKEDKMTEILLMQRMLQIGHKEDSIEEAPEVTSKRELALKIAKERLGRWDIQLGLAVMEAIGIKDPNVRVEETTRDLRLVRKYAIGLRECLNRCVEAVGGARAALLASEGPTRDLREARKKFFSVLAQLFSGKIVREDLRSQPWSNLGIMLHHRLGFQPTADRFHWSAVYAPEQQSSRNRLTQNSVGDLARECIDAKDKNTAWLLSCMSELLNDYQERVQQVESYVYMECVGIQLERHFNEKRAAALAAFEKKTDITTAMNVARKKKLGALVEELQRKLDEIGNEVTQTTVREAKELHLESKQLKSDIHDLAVRRLVRARETSTERAVALMSLWAKEEESSAAAELKAIGEAIAALERQVSAEDLDDLVQSSDGDEV